MVRRLSLLEKSSFAGTMTATMSEKAIRYRDSAPEAVARLAKHLRELHFAPIPIQKRFVITLQAEFESKI